MSKWEIGIDEAGRGPLAGPVAVGVVLVPTDFDWELLPGVRDSKQMSEQKRTEVYKKAKQLEKASLLQTVVVMGSAKQIDKKGIAVVIRELLAKGLKNINKNTDKHTLSSRVLGRSSVLGERLLVGKDHIPIDWGMVVPKEVLVKLDGGLRAPAEWVHQETIVKGDAKEKVIGLASIMAKVTRDRYMRRVASRPAYADYDFARHKGYGTKVHREAIAKHGLSSEHRWTFCRNSKLG